MPNVLEIWMATSEDGQPLDRTRQRLAAERTRAWHEMGKHAPHVVPAADGKYYLFLSAICDLHGRDVNAIPPEKHIALLVADRPEGSYEHVQDTPVLSPSLDPEAFDHWLIDDPCIIRRDGKFWLYYKGRSSEHQPVLARSGDIGEDHGTVRKTADRAGV